MVVAIITGAVAAVVGIIALIAPHDHLVPHDHAAALRCPRGLSTDQTHPYCPCSLHQGSVMYRNP